jgi:hypothetical protein
MKMLRIALSVALLLAASIPFAQTKPGDLVADIPFVFVVAGRTLPPGHYIVSNLSQTLSIHDRQNQGVLAPAHSAHRPAHENGSKMVFHRYGDTCFLSEVWVGDNSIGKRLFPSRAERELAEHGTEREVAVMGVGK